MELTNHIDHVDPIDPRDEYARRRDARLAVVSDIERREARLGDARLLVFLAGSAAAVFGAGWIGDPNRIAAIAAAVFAAGFAALAFVHARMRRSRRRSERIAGWYGSRLARMDRAVGSGDGGAEFEPENHPYAAHLDLFGPESLFEALVDARTQAGRGTLARWLLHPADAAAIRKRQEAVRDLTPLLELREERAALDALPPGPETADPVETVSGWAERRPVFVKDGVRVAAGILTATGVGATLAVLVGNIPAWTLLLVYGAEALFARGVKQRVRTAFADLEQASRELRRLAAVLGLDPAAAGEEELRAMVTPYRLNLRRDWMGNAFFAPFGAVLLWGTHHALLLESWRRRYGSEVRGWAERAGEREALLDLSAHAFEHPNDTFPAVVAGSSPMLRAAALAHPLLPEAGAVRNDVELAASPGDAPAVLCVTGANMAGKSTLLRAVGVNVVLARMGAPVRATSLEMTELRPAASIDTHDSLARAASNFYAELQAISTIVSEARKGPGVLFLLDEVMGGTDSGDREIGVAGLLRELFERDALGILTTHDRRLAENLGTEFAPRLRNVHLGWAWKGDRLDFPYRLTSGLNPSTNGVELMRLMGLDVHR